MPLFRRQFLTLGPAALTAALLPAGRARAIVESPDHLFHWDSGGPFFGGFSGIALTPDRSRAWLLSDRGFVVRARLIRDAGGRIAAVEKIDHFDLLGTDGLPLIGWNTDAEGIDLRPDGSFYVAFEGGRGGARVHHYASDRSPARVLPRVPAWREMHGNRSLEALAVDASGAVLVVPETPVDGDFPLWRLPRNGTDWQIVGRIPPRDGFLPVGLDLGPDGNLYLLERKFRLAFFATRISRLRPEGRNPILWGPPETLVQTAMGALDNHEGISVTRDTAGQIWATTVSDDNQIRLQRTELAEFRLPPAR